MDWLKKIVVRECANGQCYVTYEFSQSGQRVLGIAPDFQKAVEFALFQTDAGLTLRFERVSGPSYEFKVSGIEKF